jgi:hypothetical protein
MPDSEEAIKAVQEVLRSGKVNYWTGPRGMECERKFAQWQGSQGADIRIPDVEKMSTNRTVDLPQALLKQSIPIDAPVPNGQVRWILDML